MATTLLFKLPSRNFIPLPMALSLETLLRKQLQGDQGQRSSRVSEIVDSADGPWLCRRLPAPLERCRRWPWGAPESVLELEEIVPWHQRADSTPSAVCQRARLREWSDREAVEGCQSSLRWRLLP